MKKILIVVAIAITIGITGYVFCQTTLNRAITQEEQINDAKTSLEASLKERHDSIIQIVQVVERAASHVEKIMTQITEARKQLSNSNDTAAMAIIKVVMEQYPDIKANENFINLQNKIAQSEQQILRARKNHTYQVKEYNRIVRTFPTRPIIAFMGYETKEDAKFLTFKEEDMEPVTNMFGK